MQSRLLQSAPKQISGSAIVLMVKIEEHGIRKVWRAYSGLLSPPNCVVIQISQKKVRTLVARTSIYMAEGPGWMVVP